MAEEVMISVLRSQNPDELVALLQRTGARGEFDALIRSVLELSKQSDVHCSLPSPVFNAIGNYFGTVSAISAHHQAKELAALLHSKECRKKSMIAALLRSLVEHVPILNANKLREFVKSELVALCTEFCEEAGDRDVAAQLAFCILDTLLMELAYLRGVQGGICQSELESNSQNIWANLTKVKDFSSCALLQLSTALLHSATGTADPLKCAKNVVKRKLLKQQSDNQHLDIFSYNATLFDLLSRHLPTFCHFQSGKLIQPICEFLIENAQRCGTLDHLLQGIAKNPQIQFNQIGDSVRSALLMFIPSSTSVRPPIWPFKNDQKEKSKSAMRKVPKIGGEGEQLDWEFLLEFSEQATETEMAEIFDGVQNLKVEYLLCSTSFDGSNSPKLCLRLLNSILTIKRALSIIPIRNEFIELMLAEEEPRVYSLKFSTKLLEMHAHSDSTAPLQKSDFASFCLALFQPLHLLLNCDEMEKRDFLLSELAFLKCLLVSLPQLSSLAPLIVQIIPEFFAWTAHYRKELREVPESRFSDRLEHALVLVCREIVRRQKAFHKLLPFAISDALSGGRELRFPMYLLLAALDENDLALLSSNLPAAEKRKFSILQSQFYASNKIIG